MQRFYISQYAHFPTEIPDGVRRLTPMTDIPPTPELSTAFITFLHRISLNIWENTHQYSLTEPHMDTGHQFVVLVCKGHRREGWFQWHTWIHIQYQWVCQAVLVALSSAEMVQPQWDWNRLAGPQWNLGCYCLTSVDPGNQAKVHLSRHLHSLASWIHELKTKILRTIQVFFSFHVLTHLCHL